MLIKKKNDLTNAYNVKKKSLIYKRRSRSFPKYKGVLGIFLFGMGVGVHVQISFSIVLNLLIGLLNLTHFYVESEQEVLDAEGDYFLILYYIITLYDLIHVPHNIL